MRLLTKIGVVALTTMAGGSLALAPVTAAAKTKTHAKGYRISKTVLRGNRYVANGRHGVETMIHQFKSKRVTVLTTGAGEVDEIDYRVKKQQVKGNTMTLTITPARHKDVTDQAVVGTGKLTLVRTAKNGYTLKNAYTVYQDFESYRFNTHKVLIQGYQKHTPKKVTRTGFKVLTKKQLIKTNPQVFKSIFKYRK